MTVPVLVVPENAPPMRGTATAALSGGKFEVSNDAVKCSGTYDAMETSVNITMPVTCTDGRTGTVRATRRITDIGGEGTVAMSDGTVAKFYFGEGAGLQ